MRRKIQSWVIKNFKGWWSRWFSVHSYAYFNRNSDERKVNVNRNDNDWNGNIWFAGRRNSLHFSLVQTGEFSFTNLLCHPPKSLPKFSIFSDKAINFLLSRLFISQRTISNTFKVSVFRIANFTQGNFFSFGKNPAVETASIISTNNLSIFAPSEYLWTFGKIW